MSVRERLINRLSEHFGNVPDALRKRRLLVGIAFLAMLAASIFGIGKLHMDMTIEGWFQKEDPTLIAFNDYHAQFGSEDGVFIVYKPKDGDVFSHASLEAVRGIQEELINFRSTLKEGEASALEHIMKVKTLVNAPVLTVDGDVMLAKSLVGDSVPQSTDQLEAIRATALAERQFPLQYFSRDYRYGGIHIETDFGAIPVETQDLSAEITMSMDPELGVDDQVPVEFMPTDQTDYFNLWKEIKLIIHKPEYAQHLDYYAVGNTPAEDENVRMVEEMGNLYLAAIGLMVLLLLFLFRSGAAVVWPLAIVIFSTVFALGTAGLMGLTLTGFVILTVLFILTIGIADAVHVLATYAHLRRADHDHHSAMRLTYRRTGVALLLTTLTTMIAFMALSITPMVPIRHFAIMSTLGVFFAWVLSIYVLPVLLDLWAPVPRKPKPARAIGRLIPDAVLLVKPMLEKVVPAVEKRPVAFIIPFMLLFAFSIYGATKVRVDTQILDQYPEDSAFTQSVEVADEHMMGAYSLVLYLDFKEDFALHDPEVLNAMDALQRNFEAKYPKYVVLTSSLVDVVKDANQKLNSGNEEFYRIPDSRDVLAQTLFLLNNANPSERQRLVDDYYRRANIKVGLHSAGSYEYSIVFDEMRADVDQMMATLQARNADTEVTLTGIFALAMQAADYITRNQLIAFSLAIVTVSIVLLLVFGSMRLGAIALVPNLIPAFLILGLLGLFDIPLDFYTMMLAPIILGISVDDTVHFMTKYERHFVSDNDTSASLRSAMVDAGPGIVFTTIILGLGFGVMSFAESAGTSNLGKFGFIAITMGLLNDLFLLPALLLKFKPKFKKGHGSADRPVPAVGPAAEAQTEVEEGVVA